MAIRLGSKLIVFLALMACAPSRPDIPDGQLGMILDFTAFNRGQCDITGPNLNVDKSVVLGGDYFKVTGDITRSTIQCRLPSGQVVETTSHHQIFDPVTFPYGALIVGRIRGAGDVEVVGFNDGPTGKADLNGTFVFVPA